LMSAADDELTTIHSIPFHYTVLPPRDLLSLFIDFTRPQWLSHGSSP
jgi:hypothetical protein